MTEKENTPGFRVIEVWAFIAIDEDDDEGIPAFSAPNGMIMPMICADQKRVDSLRAIAAVLARTKSVRIELVHFSGQRELVEAFEPK